MRIVLILLALAVPAMAQQTIPLESKASFERALEQRAESVLLPILGPARSRVVVDATLDFTRIEKFDIRGGGGKDGNKGSVFLWQSVGQEAVGQSELLPGIPEPAPIPGFGGEKSYERQNSFPTEFVKRLSVTVILDDKVSVELGDELRSILQDVLDVRPDRGDSLSVLRAPFAPAWKTIWYRPDAVSLLFKYGVIALMTLITLIVVAVCFLKLAEAMDSMAQAQGNQLSMDFGEKEGEEKEGADGEGKDGAEAEEEEPSNAIYFDIKASQVETLWEILHRQDPENIALVVAHLRPEVKSAFLDRLPTKLYSSVVISLGKVKFVEPDVVQTVKEELERRCESAVGGRRQLFTMLDKADMRTKRELLAMLEVQDPEMAATVRSKVLLFEDVRWLEAREWSLLLGQVKLDDWAAAAFGADDFVRDAVKNQMAPKTWAILEQMTAASKPTAAIVDQAQENVIEVLTKLISDGKIENPVERRRKLEPAPIPVEEPQEMLTQESPLPAEYAGKEGGAPAMPVLEQEPIDQGGGVALAPPAIEQEPIDQGGGEALAPPAIEQEPIDQGGGEALAPPAFEQEALPPDLEQEPIDQGGGEPLPPPSSGGEEGGPPPLA